MATQTAYQNKLLDPRWQKKRLEILQRDDWTCQCRSDTKSTLHIHHKKYYKNPWDVSPDDLITYCEACHFIMECFIKKTDLTPLKITVRKFEDGSKNISLYCKKDGKYYLSLWEKKENSCGIKELARITETTLINAHNIIQDLKNG